jgi:hypothetical protein
MSERAALNFILKVPLYVKALTLLCGLPGTCLSGLKSYGGLPITRQALLCTGAVRYLRREQLWYKQYLVHTLDVFTQHAGVLICMQSVEVIVWVMSASMLLATYRQKYCCCTPVN